MQSNISNLPEEAQADCIHIFHAHLPLQFLKFVEGK